MKNKLQVFVSSTYLDLIEERQSAVEAILEAGHIPAGMELFKAGETIKGTIQKWIDDSDAYLLILGGRYGSIDSNTQISYTQWEYEYAVSSGKPTFAIVLSNEYLIRKERENPGTVFELENKDKYETFKTFVHKNVVYTINNSHELAKKIVIQLNEYRLDPRLSNHGWVRKEDILDYSVPKTHEKLFEELYYYNLLPNQEPIPELREFVKNQYQNFANFRNCFGLFLKNFNRNIRVTLQNEYIEIENSISFRYCKRKSIKYTHKFFPWLRPGLEIETYQFSKVKYDHDEQKNGMQYIHSGQYKSTATPFYYQGGIGIEIPLKEDEELHNISYVSRYRTEYAMFFHSYCFKTFCQSFHIHVELFDRRTVKKKEKYILKWEMYTPYSMDYAYNSKQMIQQTENIVEFNSIPWMTPSSGYIVTLNCNKS